MSEQDVLLQQIIIGLSNGTIIALIALGYTMVYGIIELINFAHGDLFMLGTFLALTLIGLLGINDPNVGIMALSLGLCLIFVVTAIFCGTLNCVINRFAYRPLRGTSKLTPLVSALGVSFILMNIGLFWGGLNLEVFNYGIAAAAPKDFPDLLSSSNLLGESDVQLTWKDLSIVLTTAPILIGLTLLVKFTSFGRSMRAVAQNASAAKLMGIDVERVIGRTFMLGGGLAGFASVIYGLYNNTINFQMGFRVGMDAFVAAILGGIGSLPGALCGGLLIGIVRAMSDQYIESRWTNAVVFAILILVLVFRPSGLLGRNEREKV